MKSANVRAAQILAFVLGLTAAVMVVAYAGSRGLEAQPVSQQHALMSIPF